MKAEFKDGVLSFVFNSPQSNNAFDLTKAKIIEKSLTKKNIALIVFSSRDRVFCSGGNLREYAKLTSKTQGVKINREITKVLQKLANYPAPKIALVTGDCFGGGIELISCCDFIWSAPHVFFGLWQRRMALSFGWGGYERLKSRMNPTLVKNELLLGSTTSAHTMKRLGLVDQIYAEAELEQRFLEFKKEILALSAESYREIKKLDKNEAAVFEKLWWSEDHLKVLKSFKR